MCKNYLFIMCRACPTFVELVDNVERKNVGLRGIIGLKGFSMEKYGQGWHYGWQEYFCSYSSFNG